MKPKKPKLLKYPKKPKSKTLNSMENYIKRHDEVKKENARRENDYKNKLKKYESLRNKIAKL